MVVPHCLVEVHHRIQHVLSQCCRGQKKNLLRTALINIRMSHCMISKCSLLSCASDLIYRSDRSTILEAPAPNLRWCAHKRMAFFASLTATRLLPYSNSMPCEADRRNIPDVSFPLAWSTTDPVLAVTLTPVSPFTYAVYVRL